MDRDPLEDMPEGSRHEVVSQVRGLLDVDQGIAEQIVRSTEPIWDGMERASGLVDTWGGVESCSSCARTLIHPRWFLTEWRPRIPLTQFGASTSGGVTRLVIGAAIGSRRPCHDGSCYLASSRFRDLRSR
jgi:hypothetical protein